MSGEGDFGRRACARRQAILALAVLACGALASGRALAQVKAQVAADIKPPWTKGIQPIGRESYWHAVECGKQGGAAPACVFWDNGLCKNDDFVLAMYTPYKQVAYTVWQAVSQKKEPPTPSYADAQRTRVVLGISRARGSKNTITGAAVRRAGKVIKPASRTIDGSRGTFIFDFAAFAPSTAITLELTGQTGTVTCAIERVVLARFR
jgi:hypothetical protein